MWHIARQHGINLQLLHDHYAKTTFGLRHAPTLMQAADICAQHCTNAAK